MKFDLTDFLELDTKALLAVNGGASCSGGSCSSGGSSYSGSCSSSGGSSYGGSCGGTSNLNKGVGSCGTSGGNCSSFGGSCGSYGGTCSISGGSNVGTSNGGGGSDNSNKPAEEKISASIQENWNKQYNYDTGYQCDNWVEEVLNDAGYDASKYLKSGNAKDKTVQDQIDSLVATGTNGVDYTKTLPTKDGAYVVFMDESTSGLIEHSALLVIENGKATIYDNSSGNGGNPIYKEDSEGNILKDEKGKPIVSYYDQGVGETINVTGKNNGYQLNGWGYSSYYYQEIKGI